MKVGLLFLNKKNNSYEINNTIKYLKKNNKVNFIYIFNISPNLDNTKQIIEKYLRKGIIWNINSILSKLVMKIENYIFSKIDYRVSNVNKERELNIYGDDEEKNKFIDLNFDFNKKGYSAELDKDQLS